MLGWSPWCVCACVCTVVLEMWQPGPFWRCGFECVFSVHSSHSFWNPANNSGLTVYIFQWIDDIWKVCVWCVGICVFENRKKCVFGPCDSVSLIAIIVVFVITAEGRETPQTDSIREKYLGTCVHPHLEKKTKRGGKKKRTWQWMYAKLFL